MVKGGRALAGLVVVMLTASPAAFAEGKGKGDPQKHLDRMTKKLELTAEQRGQVEQIMNDYRGRMQALRDQLEALKNEKHDKIKAVLSPDQQEKFDKMKHHKGRRGWFHKRES